MARFRAPWSTPEQQARRLTEILEDPNTSPERRQEAILALGRLGGTAAVAVPPLLQLATAGLHGRWDGTEDAWRVLRQLGATAVPGLIAALERAPDDQQAALLRLAEQFGPAAGAAGPRILALVADAARPAPIRAAALRAAGTVLQPAWAFDLLHRHLDDPEPALRLSALIALARLGPVAEAGQPGILDRAADPVPEVRSAALTAAATLLPREVVTPFLLRALADPAAAVRRAAREVRDAHGPPAAGLAEALLAASRSGDAGARAEAFAELRRLPAADLERAIPEIVAGLGDPERPVRLAAAETFRQLGPPFLPDLALELLHGPDGRVRLAVAQLFAGDPAHLAAVLGALGDVLDDPDPAVRHDALILLRRLGPEAVEVCARLEPLLADEAPLVRREAWWAIAHFEWTAQFAPRLIELLAHPEPALRRDALWYLKLHADAIPSEQWGALKDQLARTTWAGDAARWREELLQQKTQGGTP